MNATQASFLLIDGANDRTWLETIAEALRPLGVVDVASEREAISARPMANYALIVIDAMAGQRIPRLVGALHARWADARIIVTTSAPSWAWAREAFHAGAADYIDKTCDREEIATTVLDGLGIRLP